MAGCAALQIQTAGGRCAGPTFHFCVPLPDLQPSILSLSSVSRHAVTGGPTLISDATLPIWGVLPSEAAHRTIVIHGNAHRVYAARGCDPFEVLSGRDCSSRGSVHPKVSARPAGAPWLSGGWIRCRCRDRHAPVADRAGRPGHHQLTR